MPMFSKAEQKEYFEDCKERIMRVAYAKTRAEVVENTRIAHGYFEAMLNVGVLKGGAYGQLAAALNDIHNEKLGLPPPGKG